MSKISAMPELTAPATDDEIEVRDKSDTSQAATGTNKRMTWLTTITKIFASRFAADAGSTDTYVVTLDPAPAAYVTGEHYRFKANTANTGACTVDFNGLGAKTIKKATGGITTDLADDDIHAGQWVDLVYDGTNMQMQSTLGNAGAGAGYAGVVTGGAGSLDFAQGTKTTSEPFVDGSVTWNDAGVTFSGIRLDVTNTASAVASTLVDLLVGGATVFRVDRSGSIAIADASLSIYNTADPDTGISLAGSDVITISNNGNLRHEFSEGEYRNLTASGIKLADSAAAFRWTTSTRLLDPGNGVLQIEGNSGAQGIGLLLGVNNATQGARLVRNGVRLEAKLGDDSAYTQMTCEKLGVNNSAAATTPGSVTKKIEVFDAAGNSLGFIAVYDSIT